MRAVKQHPSDTLDSQTRWALEQLCGLRNAGFYGKLTLTFENGVVRHAEQQTSLKPPKS